MTNEHRATTRFFDSKYTGEIAREYTSQRETSPIWRLEDRTIVDMLTLVADKGCRSVVDVPVGTGRFLTHYASLGLACVGYDISEDMLKQARAKMEQIGIKASAVKLQCADIRRLDEPEHAFDIAVCVRYMQHVDFDEFNVVLRELVRVSARYVILGVHVIGDTPAARMTPLCVAAKHPIRTVRHIHNTVRKRKNLSRASRAPAKSANYMMTADNKPYTAVLKTFGQCGLVVRGEKLMAAGTNPMTAHLYKMFLLEVV